MIKRKWQSSPMNVWHRMAGATCAVVVATLLSACAAPVVLGGAVLGSSMALDRRASGQQLVDEGIEFRMTNVFYGEYGDRAHINTTSFNQRVLLTGEAPTPEAKARIEQLVRERENVKAVINEVAVMEPTHVGIRSTDTWITGRVKASLVDAQDLSALAFKVVTERNVVYLMGRVTQREANRASDIARVIPNVQKVVRVFEIITEQELQQLTISPSGNSQSASAPAPVTRDGQP